MTNTHTPVKPKRWLIDNGHMSADKINQRGRLSLANVALIQEAVANGALIEGYSVTKPTGPITDSDAPAKVERVAVNAFSVLDIGEPIRPESSWSAHAIVDGKKIDVGMRTVDNGCGNSLNYCYCTDPIVYIGQNPVPVKFVAA